MKLLILALALVVALAMPASAVDFSAKITQLDGSPLTDRDGKPTDVTLGQVSEFALLAVYPDEQAAGKMTADEFNREKARRFALAQRIHDAKGDLPLSSEDITLLKRLIGMSYGALIMGRAWQLLDPASIPARP